MWYVKSYCSCWIMLNYGERTCDMLNHDGRTCDKWNHQWPILLNHDEKQFYVESCFSCWVMKGKHVIVSCCSCLSCWIILNHVMEELCCSCWIMLCDMLNHVELCWMIEEHVVFILNDWRTHDRLNHVESSRTCDMLNHVAHIESCWIMMEDHVICWIMMIEHVICCIVVLNHVESWWKNM